MRRLGGVDSLIGILRFRIGQLIDAALSCISEERCRLCHALLGIAHILFESSDDELSKRAPALLHTISPGPYKMSFSKALCQACWNELSAATPLLGYCGGRDADDSFDFGLTVASGSAYTGKIKKLIHRLKFNGDQALAQDLAALAMASWSLIPLPGQAPEVVLVPVPLHWRRRVERGFNQSELIARILSRYLNCPLKTNALMRIKFTRRQQKLSQQDRQDNVASAFVANPRLVQDKVVVLVDDVCTSGATLTECARQLMQSGARSVLAITAARALMRRQPTPPHPLPPVSAGASACVVPQSSSTIYN